MRYRARAKPQPQKKLQPHEITSEMWDVARADYEMTKASLRMIAARYRIPLLLLRQTAMAQKWLEFAPKMKARNDKAIEKLRATAQHTHDPREAYAAMALAQELQGDIVERHKGHIAKAYRIADDMLSELQAQKMQPEDLQRIAELMALAKDQDNPPDSMAIAATVASWRKLLSLGNRVDTLAKLSGAMGNLIKLERQAHGVAEVKQVEGTTDNVPTLTANDAARRIAFALLLGQPKTN
jgi:hypothetical protein